MKILIYLWALTQCSYFSRDKAVQDTICGIRFEENLSWAEVLTKAKKENKYIFVECYSTLCESCRVMDRDVYLDRRVGEYMNKKFVSVKVQVDSSILDNELTKAWYLDARGAVKKYKLTSTPTYLFFSPDGNIVHKDFGMKGIGSFINLAANALDTFKQYYTLVQKYQGGKKEYATMRYLSMAAKANGDNEMSNEIAQDYIDNYLCKVTDKLLYTKENIEFIRAFTVSSKEWGFKLFYNNRKKIDRMMDIKDSSGIVGIKNYSDLFLDYIIIKEEILPYDSFDVKTPDWIYLKNRIGKLYGKRYSERILINSQIRYYNERKDWVNLIKYNIQKIKTYGLDTAGIGKFLYNNLVWELIFTYSNDKNVLSTAIKWMEAIVKNNQNNAAFIDTYANLLYKVGRIKEAISWERIAIKIDEDNEARMVDSCNKNYHESVLKKMLSGTPTWPTE